MKRAFTRSLGIFLAAVMTFSSAQVTAAAADYSYLTEQSSTDNADDGSASDELSGIKDQISSMLGSTDEADDGEEAANEEASGEATAATGETAEETDEAAEVITDEEDAVTDEASTEESDEAIVEASDESATDATTHEDEEEKEILKAGSWSYYLDEDGYAHIVDFSDTEKSSVTVPKKMGKYFAVAIEDGTFSGATNLKSVKIPFYIREIGSDVFNSDVTISAYHGAYALDYAAENGYGSTDLSEYDFADGAIDLTEIQRSHYFFITDTEIEMNKLEVSYLEDHPVFYLPPSDEISNGDAFKIISKEDAGENYILHCERAIGREVLKRLVIDEKDLRPDWDNAIYYNDSDYDGIYEEYTTDDMEQIDDHTYNLYGFGSFSQSFGTALNYDISFKIPNKGKDGSAKSDVKIEASGSDDTTYSVAVDIDFTKGQVKKFEVIKKQKQDFSFTLTGSVSKTDVENKKTIPVAKVPLKEPGLVNLYAVVQLVYSVEGSISFTYETSETTGFRVVGDEIQEIKDVAACDTSFEVAAKAKAGIQIGLELDALNDVVSAEVKLEGGVQLAMSRDLSENAMEAQLSAYAKLYFALSVEFFDFVSFDLEKDFLETDYVIKTITFDKYTVMFSSGKGDNIPAQTVLKGGYATEPDVGYSKDQKGIQGWYTDAKFTHQWNFETDKVTSDMVLYAKWGRLYAVTYDYNLEGTGVYKAIAVEGTPVLNIGGAKVSNYRFIEWTRDREGKEKWNMDTDLMPAHDLTLYGQYRYEEGYNPWDEDICAGDTIIENGISYSADGFTFNIVTSGTEKYAEITGYEGNGGTVAIPTRTEDGIKVHSLKNGALAGNLNIKAVKIPNNLYYDMGVLSGCTNLESVSIPNVMRYSYNGGYGKYNLVYLFYSSSDLGPIVNYPKLKKVTLTGNITEIPDNAFKDWTQLEEVDYPDTVTTIGSSAFEGCTGLKELPISSHIRTINTYAFASCTGISRIDIPDSVKAIGGGSFSGCTGVTGVNLPNNGLRIYDGAFSNLTNITSIVIPSTDGYEQGAFSGCTNVESVSIPDVIRYSYNGGNGSYNLVRLFYSSSELTPIVNYPKLKKVTLTGNITEIHENAFKDWTQIEEVNYPDTVTTIGSNAFAGCTGLKKLPISSHIKTINTYAFASCTGISRIDIPDSVKAIGGGSFSGCTEVTEVNLPNNGLRIYDGAFSNLTNITSIVIPSTDGYEQGAFSGCTNVESVSIPDVIRYSYNGGNGSYNLVRLFYSSSELTPIVNYPKLKKVTLTGNITEIHEDAFKNWTQLEEVNYPDSVTTLAEGAFFGCSGLKALPNLSNITRLEDMAFYDCTGISRIDIPDSVTTIGTSCFSGCSEVSEVKLPNNGLYINSSAFANLTKITNIVIPEKDSYSKGAFNGCTNVESVSIPHIIRYSDYSGSGRYNLLYLLSSYSNTGRIVSYPNLKKVTLTSRSSTQIPEYAFDGWTQLEEINLPEVITTIGSRAFNNCSGLKSFTIGRNVTKIASDSFTGCTGLKKLIVLNNNVDISKIPIEPSQVLYTASDSEVGDENEPEPEPEEDTVIYAHPGSQAEKVAKSKGINFKDVDDTYAEVRFVLNNGISDYVTYGEIGKTVEEPPAPAYIGNVFSGWYYDKALTMPWSFAADIIPYGGLTLYADWNASSRTTDSFSYEIKGDYVSITGYVGSSANVLIPDKIENLPVKEIGDKAFAYDEDVVKVTIPQYVETIASNAFIESANLKEFAVNSNNNSFAVVSGVLFDMNKERLIAYPPDKYEDTYAVPATVKIISPNAFYGAGIKTISSDAPLREIGDMAFANCENLEKVTLPQTFESYGKFVFWNNKNVSLYGPVGHAALKAFAAEECVDYNLYKLTFISEGNKKVTSSVEAGSGIADNLRDLLKDLDKKSYKLANWTYVDGEETGTWDFDNDKMPQHDLTLTATWNCIFIYAVNEDGTGVTITGTGVDSSDYVIPETLDGYKVVGIAEGSFARDDIESVTVPAGVSNIEEGAFYEGTVIIADRDTAAAKYAAAHEIDFSERRYALTFESNGGSGCKIRYYAKGDQVTELPAPVKDNSEFLGWFKDPELKNAFDIETEVFPGEALTLYASWKKLDRNLENDVFAYETENGGVTITGYSGSSSYLNIPGAINGVTVTAIGEYAFSGNESLVFVSIPETVRTIGKRAFYSSSALERVELTGNINSIGEYAFASCNSLNSIDLSGLTVTELPKGLFAASAHLYDVKLPASLQIIGDDCFAGCSFLQNIELPEGLIEIGSYAFFNDKVLQELSIPSNVCEIGDSFVDGCSSLRAINAASSGSFVSKDGILYRSGSVFRCPEAYEGNIVVEDNVTDISKDAFRNCALITGITLGNRVTMIGNSAFAGCSSLMSFAFGDAPVNKLGENAFYGCVALTDIVIPESLKTIGRSAFAGCRSLEALTVGANVTSIGKNAFVKTDALTVYGYADTAVARYAESEKNFRFEYIAEKALTPAAPKVQAVENTTITLEPVAGNEYRVNDGQWQYSNVFKGLKPLTAYIVYQRVAESPYHHVSDASEGTAVMTGKAVGAAVKNPAIIKITSSSVELGPIEGAEYSIDGENYQAEARFDNLRQNTSYTVYQRMAETDTASCGPVSSVNFTTKVHTGNYIVTFDLQGGKLEEKEGSFTVSLAEGEKPADPGIPVKDGCIFMGWGLNNAVYDFDTEITNDITLTAMWQEPQKVKTPVSDIENMSVVEKGTALTLTTQTPDAVIYYTLDGSAPDRTGTRYDGPIVIEKDVTIKAIAVKDGYEDSELLTVILTVKPEDVPVEDEDDVPAEDIPEGGIPEGIWIAGLRDYDYTGAAITQDIRVYDGKKPLAIKTDYTVSYVNNKNVGTAKVVITGKGNYSGKHEFEFAINAMDISASEFTAEDIYVTYNGKAQKPSIALLRKNSKLAAGKDFTASWKNENGKENEGIKTAGDYEILLEGRGNYKGSRTTTFHVVNATLITKVTAKTVKSVAYTGEAVRPEIVLTDKKYTLIEGVDYLVNWPEDCISVGDVTVKITGIGNYAGERKLTYKITGTAIKTVVVTGLDSSYIYAGSEITPAGGEEDSVPGTVNLTYTDKKTKVKSDLVKGRDYTVTYKNNNKKGTASVIFTGKGRYTGTLTRKFTIKAYDLTGDAQKYVEVNFEKEVPYAKNGSKPKVQVMFRGAALTEGTDFTVSYANNKAVTTDKTKKLPSVTVKGKGSFAGTIKAGEFRIVPQDISLMIISAADKVRAEKAKAFISAPVLVDINASGAKLAAGKDYEKNIVYKYGEDTTVTVGKDKTSVVKHADEVIDNSDVLPLGAIVKAEVTGMGNYTGSTYCYYRIIKADVSKATVKIRDQYYTGSEVTLNKDDFTRIAIGKENLTPYAFEIVSYKNNKYSGTATVVIEGKGVYGGTKTCTFKILKKSIN